MTLVEGLILLTSLVAIGSLGVGWTVFFVTSIKKRKLREQKSERDIKLEILKLEFEYAKESSLQAQKDRLSLLNFYIGLYAAVATISFGANEIFSNSIREIVPYIFVGLSVLSFVFVVQQVRLRQSWFESVKVMNQIKEYFFDKDNELKDYILWTIDTLPKQEKFNTINFFSSLVISLLGSVALATSFALLELYLSAAILVGIFCFIFLMSVYYLMLRFRL